MIGLTASCGWNRAEEPTTASTRSNSGAASMMSSACFITSYRVPASVRSSTRPGAAEMPAAASFASVSAEGGCTVTSRTPSWSTAIAAPPPVVVTTPTRRDTWPGVGRGRRFASGKVSSSASSTPTRATPRSLRKASATSSSPASAPVCVAAISAAASERPSL